MKVFASQLNVKTEEYRNRRNHYLQLLAELNLRGKTVRQPPPEAAAKLQKRGKHPARDKIQKILDPD